MPVEVSMLEARVASSGNKDAYIRAQRCLNLLDLIDDEIEGLPFDSYYEIY